MQRRSYDRNPTMANIEYAVRRMLEALKGPNQKIVSAMIVEFEPGLLAPEVPIRKLLSKVFYHATNAVLVEH